ncbi:ATP-binding cassette domain-containing protein [Patulibacter sp. SYSU D01012]|uniref:ABC transporter ATP-binding protein n=1 Tax=Patulibacter sp. SYSU D01012 TaxID=2817381 RepID=UPI001B316C9E|nr:ATP-binding cassette domain-containing protein [Patulibacter sp. SYSU D01012]
MPQTPTAPAAAAPADGHAPTTAPLRAEGLSVSYGRNLALQPIDLTVPEAGLVLVLGPNGAGKTTLMRALAGAVTADRGRVLVDERDVTDRPAFRRVGDGISLVPEGRGVLPGISVRDNLELGWRAAPSARRRPHAEEIGRVMELFPILRERLDQDCSSLSGGEMQLLAIGRALLSRPRVLLLDEPSLGLAPRATARVYAALGELVEGGLSVLLVEQKAVPLRRPPERTLVLQNGRVIEERVGEHIPEQRLAELYLGEVA